MFPSSLLGKWLVFISIVSLFNTAQCFIGGVRLTKIVYQNGDRDGNDINIL